MCLPSDRKSPFPKIFPFLPTPPLAHPLSASWELIWITDHSTRVTRHSASTPHSSSLPPSTVMPNSRHPGDSFYENQTSMGIPRLGLIYLSSIRRGLRHILDVRSLFLYLFFYPFFSLCRSRAPSPTPWRDMSSCWSLNPQIAHHGSEVIYVLGGARPGLSGKTGSSANYTEADARLSDTIMNYW